MPHYRRTLFFSLFGKENERIEQKSLGFHPLFELVCV